MRDLNEIISRNARLALERAKKAAADEGESLTQAEVARRMAGLMVRPRGSSRSEEWTPETIYRTLTELLNNRRPWRADFIEAFARAVGGTPERLVALDYDGTGKVADATHAHYLATALGRRLEPKEARRIIRNLNRELDRPGMYELVTAVAEALLSAPTVERAFMEAGRLIQSSAGSFDRKAAKPKGDSARARGRRKNPS